MSWNKPAPTLTTKFISISNGRFGHPEENRAISIREGATLQTFPKNYVFYTKSIGVAARMIGNAVPPEYAIKKMYENDSNRNVFKKFIEYIRFPFFKNFENNLKVNFSFPITFIVGQNGAGKSSLLHALYGAPKGKSVEEFWYTTDLDPIKDLKDNRHCFIYSYKTEFTKQNIEVLKIRIQNRDKKF